MDRATARAKQAEESIMKLPSFQFYPGDWMKDPSLRSVSRAIPGEVVRGCRHRIRIKVRLAGREKLVIVDPENVLSEDGVDSREPRASSRATQR